MSVVANYRQPSAFYSLFIFYHNQLYSLRKLTIAGYNKVLSDKRAKACADYLRSKGVDETKLTFESFGACCPVEMELINGRDNADGRAKNRRGLINISYPPKEEED